MKTVYIARRIRIHPSLPEVVDAKLAKLERFLPRTVQAHVVVKREKNDVAVEVAVAGRHHTWKATASGPDQRTAAQEVMDRIAAQVKKTKALVKEEKKRSGPSVRKPEGWPETETARADRAGTGPRRETAAAQTMFEEDALAAFHGSTSDVLVYRDLGADAALRVLYRRRDGRVGLVVPE
jgi:ribosomal subunit interface protein